MSEPRQLPTVIASLLEVIPADQTRLRRALTDIEHQAHYTAPELLHYRWAEVAAALSDHVPQPPPLWDAACRRIFNGSNP